MVTGTIAIPTADTNGLSGKRSGHFGHCAVFTLVTLDQGSIKSINTLANEPHDAGGCQKVVHLLKQNNVDTVIVSGMGNGPFKKLTKEEINILFADKTAYPDVQSVIDGLHENTIQPFKPGNLCKGSGNCHQHGKVMPVIRH